MKGVILMRKFNVVIMMFLMVMMVTLPVNAELSKELIIDVPVNNQNDVVKISNMGIDIAGVRNNIVTVVVSETDINKLENEGFKLSKTRTTSDDLRARFTNNGKTAADAGAYHTYEENRDQLKEWAKNYPELASFKVIGKTFENRDVHALKITGNKTVKTVPKFLVLGMHHSREWITVEVPLQFAKLLLEKYGKDDKITKLVNEREIWFVPVVNPDGLIWSQTQYSYWRKNRNDNGGGSSIGVDPNRNYGYQWGNVGASDSPGSNTYHGTGPFSELCTQNIMKLAQKEKFTADISYHSSGQLILYPWSYTGNSTCPDDKLFSKIAKEMAQLNKYRPQQSADLYPSMGDTDDWMYGVMGSLSFTFELGRQFIPKESEIDSICDKNNKAMLHLLDAIGTVHASNNPLHISALNFKNSQLSYFEGLSSHIKKNTNEKEYLYSLDNQISNTRNSMVSILTPENDLDGNNFREFIELYNNSDNKDILVPVIEDLRTLYVHEMKDTKVSRIINRRIEILDRLVK